MTLVVIPDENKQRLLLEYLLLEETTAEEYVIPFHSSYTVLLDFIVRNFYGINFNYEYVQADFKAY